MPVTTWLFHWMVKPLWRMFPTSYIIHGAAVAVRAAVVVGVEVVVVKEVVVVVGTAVVNGCFFCQI